MRRPLGTQASGKDLEQNTIRDDNCGSDVQTASADRVSSTGSNLWRPDIFPTPRRSISRPDSLYGARSSTGRADTGPLPRFRFSTVHIYSFVLGERYTLPRIRFCKSLLADRAASMFSGNGRQRKSPTCRSPLHRAMAVAIDKATQKSPAQSRNDESRRRERPDRVDPGHPRFSQTEYSGRRARLDRHSTLAFSIRSYRGLGWQPRINIRQGIVRHGRWWAKVGVCGSRTDRRR